MSSHQETNDVSADELPGNPATKKVWKPYQKFLFRVAFVFFILVSIPFGEGWYKALFEIDWLNLHYRDLYSIARFQPNFDFIKFSDARGGLNDYASWGNALIIALAAALIWSLLDRRRKNYEVLYYWLRVVVRYRAAIGIIGFGYTKLLPTQMPYPSWGLLNTNFGDFTGQKIYWLSVSIVPWYQVFGGVVELLAGILLLYRRTTFLGAALLVGALGTITYVNYAYNGGVHVYAAYFVLLGAFLMIQDIPNLYNLLIREKLTIPNEYYPDFSKGWLKYTRFGLKFATVFIFLIVFGYVMTVNFIYDPYKQPSTKGVSELRGNYEVVEFRVNNQPVPYSPEDSVRWRDVTFEKWSTLAFNINRPVKLDLSNGGGSPMRDINRTFEIAGVGGGKKVFYYEADTVNRILFLQNKVAERGSFEGWGEGRGRRGTMDRAQQAAAAGTEAPESQGRENRRNAGRETGRKKPDDWIPESSRAHIGDEDSRIAEIARTTRRTRGIESEKRRESKRERLILHYQSRNKGDEVVLSGVTEQKDSLYIVLSRTDRKYLLSRSTLEAGKY